jgi:hypothetical protein
MAAIPALTNLPTATLFVKSSLPPLSFGIDGSLDRLRLLFFIKCLSAGWTGVLHNSERKTEVPGVLFSRRLEFVPPPGQPIPFSIQLYWTSDFRLMSLFFWPREKDTFQHLGDSYAGLHFAFQSPDELHITPESGPPPFVETCRTAYEHGHPFHMLACFAFRVRERPHVDGAILDYFPFALADSLMRRQSREKARADFVDALKKHALGWTTLYLNDKADSLMETVILDDRKWWIYGLTQVFPWAVHMLTECGPNCTMTDATFEILDNYVLEILHVIVRNESIPIAQAIFPTETTESYIRLFSHVIDVLKSQNVDPAVLLTLPLVSDHGKGLEGLVAALLLEWKNCHRHLIENAGSASLAGEWVRRLLLCCCAAECARTASTIRLEIDKLSEEEYRQFCEPKNHQLIKRMLHAIQLEFMDTENEVDLHLDDFVLTVQSMGLCAWARWLRLGCPTTSNAGESIHRWLNTMLDSLTNARFFTRWQKETEYLTRRFLDRNSPKRVHARSSINWAKEESELEKLERPLTEDQAAYARFYDFLYSADGEPLEDPE